MKRKGDEVFVYMVKILLLGVICIAMFTGVFAEKSFAFWPWEGKEKKPEILRMALIPAEDIEAMMGAFEPARKYLEKELGMEIEMFKATDYTAVIEAMRAEKIDIAFFGPFSYVLAAQRAGAQAIIGGGDKKGVLGVYHSIMIAHRDSGLKNIDDVKKRANELTFSFVDPASTSGHLIPRGYMQSIGLYPDKDFKEVIFAGGHDASVLAVGKGKVDLGATWEGPHRRAIDAGVIRPEDAVVIWKSDGIPRSPVAVRGDMSISLARKIQQAFLDMPRKAPEAMGKYEALWEGNKYYMAVDDSTYDFIRAVASGLGKLN